MRTMIGAAAMMLAAGAANAATVGAGYSWTANDGSLSMFVPIEEGQDFDDLVQEQSALADAFSTMLGSQFPAAVGQKAVEAQIYQFSFGYPVFPEGGPEDGCLLSFAIGTRGSLSYDTGVLSRVDEVLITEAPGSSCELSPIAWSDEELIGGTWAAVGLPPSPVPLPASGALLALAMVGLAGACRRKR